jgi:hypothetical protein
MVTDQREEVAGRQDEGEEEGDGVVTVTETTAAERLRERRQGERGREAKIVRKNDPMREEGERLRRAAERNEFEQWHDREETKAKSSGVIWRYRNGRWERTENGEGGGEEKETPPPPHPPLRELLSNPGEKKRRENEIVRRDNRLREELSRGKWNEEAEGEGERQNEELKGWRRTNDGKHIETIRKPQKRQNKEWTGVTDGGDEATTEWRETGNSEVWTYNCHKMTWESVQMISEGIYNKKKDTYMGMQGRW